MHKEHYLWMTAHSYSQSILNELILGEDFKDVEIRDHACGSVILKIVLFCWNGTSLHLLWS